MQYENLALDPTSTPSTFLGRFQPQISPVSQWTGQEANCDSRPYGSLSDSDTVDYYDPQYAKSVDTSDLAYPESRNSTSIGSRPASTLSDEDVEEIRKEVRKLVFFEPVQS